MKLRAVVVDDNALNRELVARTLIGNGVETSQAKDALSGWREIESCDPQLAVIDVMMPGPMDGVGLCQLIRACPRYASLLVIMVTASDKRKEAERALNAGADVLLSKPFSPRELWTQIELLLKGKKSEAPAPRIFILDDNETDCRLAQTVLSKAGYDILAETDPAGAVAAVKNFQPDLLILDVVMARLSGPDFAGIIAKDRSIPKKPSLLFYSNKSKNELEELVVNFGAKGYACKTEGPAALIRAVHGALNPQA